jgi:hypothetical protein
MVHEKRRGTTFALGLVLAAGAALTGVGCGVDKPAPAAAAVESGAVALQIQGTANLTLATVSYRVSGPAGTVRAATIDVSHSTTISLLIGDLPAGSGYTIALDATASDGTTTCSGSGGFDIVAGMTSTVSVHLICFEGARTGNVVVDGTLNVCPVIDGLGVSPAEVSLDGAIALTAFAHDSDGGPAPLSYRWSASSGALSDPVAANPTFVCTAVGPATLTLVVTDGDTTPGCADTQSLTVDCLAAFAAEADDLATGRQRGARVAPIIEGSFRFAERQIAPRARSASSIANSRAVWGAKVEMKFASRGEGRHGACKDRARPPRKVAGGFKHEQGMSRRQG